MGTDATVRMTGIDRDARTAMSGAGNGGEVAARRGVTEGRSNAAGAATGAGGTVREKGVMCNVSDGVKIWDRLWLGHQLMPTGMDIVYYCMIFGYNPGIANMKLISKPCMTVLLEKRPMV